MTAIKKYTKEQLDKWFNQQDFETLEEITGYNLLDFDPEDGYEEFVEACHDYWNDLPHHLKEGYFEIYD